MALGLFAPLPLRLGGSAEEGWSPADHARVCADLVALKRNAFLAVWTYTKSGALVTIHDYYGLNGAGIAYAPDDITPSVSPGTVTFKWSTRQFEDPYQIVHPINAKAGKACGHGSVALRGKVTVVANGVIVDSFNGAGAAADGKLTVVLT